MVDIMNIVIPSEFMDKGWVKVNSQGKWDVLSKEEYDETLVTKLEQGMEILHWYEAELLKLYSQNKNLLAISRETKIPYRSLLKTIRKAKTLLKYKIRNNELD